MPRLSFDSFARPSFSSDIDDPLSRAVLPPANESPRARAARLLAEQEARRRSEEIDEELNRQRVAEKKSPKCVKILLLGGSYCNTHVIHQSFRLVSVTPQAFRAETALWRDVVHLNVVRSICLILDVIAQVQAVASTSRHASPEVAMPPELPPVSEELQQLKTKLVPLYVMEESLLRRLSPTHNNSFGDASLGFFKCREIAVNVNSRKNTLNISRLLNPGSHRRDDAVEETRMSEAAVMLETFRDDLIKLWNDPIVKLMLQLRKIRVEDVAGFYLDQLGRVTKASLFIAVNDILRARIKTVGVSEHRFRLKTGTYVGNTVTYDWKIYDVGGARTLAAAWVPFFTDMNAIIFLAPISCFDQVLEEDNTVNRLEDSFALWKSIVSHPLLKSTDLILFLNKCDILQAKLATGLQFRRYVTSYGDKPNTFEATSSYLRKKFSQIHRKCSLMPRVFYSHLTVRTPNQCDGLTFLCSVRDMLVRKNLHESNLV
ncbi:G-alpha-domain-containing protein [Fistulina hepatica ATCC 64428]|nr:G-alpha-domain-containing protein [Fistulina hepatica ATCC 64428]